MIRLFPYSNTDYYRAALIVGVSLATQTRAMMTNSAVSELAARSYLQRALQSPNHPRSILSFYYNVDFSSSTHQEELRRGVCFASMSALWYGGGAKYDQWCQPFGRIIRQRATHPDYTTDSAWNYSVDSLVAEIVLFDQLSRNTFRGTREAYAYDAAALERSRVIAQLVLHDDDETTTTVAAGANSNNKLTGEVYPPFLFSTIQSLMHSERLSDHELTMQLLQHAISSAYYSNSSNGNNLNDVNSSVLLTNWWHRMLQHEYDHKQVIEQFGRYPHRNPQMNRINTPQEDIWLASADLPPWAK